MVVSHAPCPMSHASCPIPPMLMPHASCSMLHAPCPMFHAPCPSPFPHAPCPALHVPHTYTHAKYIYPPPFLLRDSLLARRARRRRLPLLCPPRSAPPALDPNSPPAVDPMALRLSLVVVSLVASPGSGWITVKGLRGALGEAVGFYGVDPGCDDTWGSSLSGWGKAIEFPGRWALTGWGKAQDTEQLTTKTLLSPTHFSHFTQHSTWLRILLHCRENVTALSSNQRLQRGNSRTVPPMNQRLQRGNSRTVPPVNKSLFELRTTSAVKNGSIFYCLLIVTIAALFLEAISRRRPHHVYAHSTPTTR